MRELVEYVADEDLDEVWRAAAGDERGAFLVGTHSNRARVSHVARGWAEVITQTLPMPTLAMADAHRLYPRLQEGVEGAEWLATVVVARAMSSFAREATAQGDGWIPRLNDERASGWVVYALPRPPISEE